LINISFVARFYRNNKLLIAYIVFHSIGKSARFGL